jgi:ParB family chromosome partitioning protein
MSAEKPRRLGRGLRALLPDAESGSASVAPPIAGELQRIPISRIRPNPFQPRRTFEPAELAELQASLQASGLLQPISVRQQGDAFELIAGERRLRAATNLGWTEISAVVHEIDDQTMLVMALVENLQRANLNPIEEARGYRRLIDDFGLTQQEIADGVGKDRTTVTNLLRVLSLPDAVQQLVESGALTAGHARALLALGPGHSVLELAREAAAAGMSVRQLEQRVRELSSPSGVAPNTAAESVRKVATPKPSTTADPAVRRIEDDLRRYLQTDVHVRLSGEAKGSIEMRFYSNDDLDRLLDLILREARADF